MLHKSFLALSALFFFAGCMTGGETDSSNGGGPVNDSLGLTWQKASFAGLTDEDFSANDVVWFKGSFVAVGHFGRIATSPDGLQWTARSSGTTGRLLAIASSGNQLLALGDGNLALSNDGINWTLSADSVEGEDVVWAGTKWVVTGNVGSMTSTDGKTWTVKRDFLVGLTKMVWNGKLVVGMSLTSIKTSVDGLNWTTRLQTSDEFWNALEWTGTKVVVAGSDVVRTSENGITWSVPKPLQGYPNSLFWTGNRIVALTENKFMVSPDGDSWTTRTLPVTGNVWRIAGSRQKLVAVSGPNILVSP